MNSFQNKLVVVKHEGYFKNHKRKLFENDINSKGRIQEYVCNYLKMIQYNQEEILC